MAKIVGGLVHSGDATAHFTSYSNPTGNLKGSDNPAHAKPPVGYMMDPVKVAKMMLHRGGK